MGGAILQKERIKRITEGGGNDYLDFDARYRSHRMVRAVGFGDGRGPPG
jgi:hypothetical protein